MSELGVAVVGAGGVGVSHLAATGRVEGVRLAAVCDVDAARARAAAATYGDGARWTDSVDELLAWPEVDGVVVCTPNDSHVAIGEAALAAGRHVLMEKPLALDLAGADALVAAAARAGRVLMPGHTHRFYDYGRSVRAAIADVAGEPRYARLSLLGGWIWTGWDAWVLDPARSGGHVLHNGVHGIDLVSWWLDDEAVEVVAVGQKATSHALAIWDYFSVALRFRRGGAAVVELSRGDRPRTASQRSLVVAGTRGVLSVAGADWGGELRTEAGAAPLDFDVQAGFDRQLAAFAAAATGRAEPPVTAVDGRRAVAAALAAEESIATGRAVPI